MTKAQRQAAIERAKQSGQWMVRFDNDGEAYKGFRWSPVGQWTEAPDWDTRPVCGYGLHGQGPEAYGHVQMASRFVFCDTGPERVVVDGNKVKVSRARILAVGAEAVAALAGTVLEAWAAEHVHCEGHHIIREGKHYLGGTATAEVTGGYVYAYDSSRVESVTGGYVYAYDSSRVESVTGGYVYAYDSSRVESVTGGYVYAYGSSTVASVTGGDVRASGSSRVESVTGGYVYAYGSSRVESVTGGYVYAYDSSRVESVTGGTVDAYDSAKIIKRV